MKGNFKKLLAVFMVAVACFCFCACEVVDLNNSGSSSTKTEQSNSENSADNSGSNGDNASGGNSNSNGNSSGGNSNSNNNSSSVNGGNNSSSNNSNNNSSGGNSSGDSGNGTPTGDETVVSQGSLVSYKSVSEGANVIWTDSNIANAKAYYRLCGSSSYTEADSELIRTVSGKARVDYLGLKAGFYDLKVVPGSGSTIEIANISIAAYDRSGYAHFKYTNGVGAYKDDGTLKSGVKVVYFSESTKNSTVNGFSGLVAAVQAGNVCVRIIGEIKTNTLNSSGSWVGSETQLNGLTTNHPSGDSYYNMCDVKGKSNITVEGVGNDAKLYQWGFTFKTCNSVEVRNLTFADYPEDACSFEGSTSNPKTYGNYWVHNNQFNVGKNAYNRAGDKAAGDGSTDIKGVHGVTFSYNYYNGCQKTGLVGGDDAHLDMDITYHHNYYNNCKSRTPLLRQANVHMYNNYFKGATSYVVSLRAE